MAKIGFQKAMSNKWVQLCGEGKKNVKRVAQDIDDKDRRILRNFNEYADLENYDKKVVDMFKKRKLIQ